MPAVRFLKSFSIHPICVNACGSFSFKSHNYILYKYHSYECAVYYVESVFWDNTYSILVFHHRTVHISAPSHFSHITHMGPGDSLSKLQDIPVSMTRWNLQTLDFRVGLHSDYIHRVVFNPLKAIWVCYNMHFP